MKKKTLGFTLVEMLLVLVVMASVLILITNYGTQRMSQYRLDRTAMQMQQILNAGLAYYVANGKWPTQLSDLQNGNYLPTTLTSPYGTGYTVAVGSTPSVLTVTVYVPTYLDAQILAGELPLASATQGTQYSSVTAQVLIPGQNLNNARSVNFASVYHTGGCVPVPACPNGMTAQIVVTPASVSGVLNAPTNSSGNSCSTSPIYNSSGVLIASGDCSSITAFPITSFTAYTTGPTATPGSCDGTSGNATCYGDVSSGGVWSAPSPASPSGNYWRVCLAVQTQNGNVVVPTSGSGLQPPGSGRTYNMFWAQAEGYIVAFTRCTPNGGEPSGSSLNVWGN